MELNLYFLNWDSRSSENMAAKFMKRDIFIQMVIFEHFFHFCIFRQNFNCHTSPTSMANFCIGFWNDIEDKSLRKTIFKFYQFTVKIISVVPCLKALNSIENLHHLSETNRIENYECFQVVGFEILAKSAKMKKTVCKWPPEKPWKWK